MRRAGPWDVARLFLRLGLTAFGGPAAHVAMMEAEVVRRRGWLTAAQLLDYLGAASLLPGPSSSELALFIGYDLAGGWGLVAAGVCFILPAAILTGLLAWVYVALGALPAAAGVLHGVKPVVFAIVAQALAGLAPRASKTPLLAVVAAATVIASLAGVQALALLVAAGAVTSLVEALRRRSGADAARALPWLAAHAGPAAAAAPVSLVGLLLVFLKFGATVFGSGYVLLAFLREDLVVRLHWLTEGQLLDAVAVGQVTPGPVFTTATFVGYVVGGVPGAIVATVGIFLPGFVLVALSRPLLARVRGSPIASAFLDGVNVASVALMAVVTLDIGRAALVDGVTVAVAVVAGVALVRFKTNSAWLLAGGALAGLAAGRAVPI